jgi:hypothetical protein
MGQRTKEAISIAIEEHLEILEQQNRRAMTCVLKMANKSRELVDQTFKHAFSGVAGSTHPDVLCLYDLNDYKKTHGLKDIGFVFIYSYYCPCSFCKTRWIDIPTTFGGIDFKWAFFKWYSPDNDNEDSWRQGQYLTESAARYNMGQMVANGWKMRHYGKLTDNTMDVVPVFPAKPEDISTSSGKPEKLEVVAFGSGNQKTS